VLVSPKIAGKARDKLIEAARAGQDLDARRARYVRVIEYDVPGRDGDGKGELIALITTITGWQRAPAAEFADACYQRWEHETGNDQLKTHLRGPGKVLRSRGPDMARQEIYGYLLAHHAVSALICQAATEADIDPDRVKFTRAVRAIRRAIAPAAFPPQPLDEARAAVMADITRKRNLNPKRRQPSSGSWVARWRRNSSNAPHSQRIRRLASDWCGRGGNRCAQSRRTSSKNPASLRRPSRWRTSAMASSPASEQAGAGPGRGATAMAPAATRSSISTQT
jgi:hypothetical protein